MTTQKRHNRQQDIDVDAVQPDGYSFGASQTGVSSTPQREPNDLDEPGADVAVTMLDYDGSPVVTAQQAREDQFRSTEQGT